VKQGSQVGKNTAICVCVLAGSLLLAACQAFNPLQTPTKPTPNTTPIPAIFMPIPATATPMPASIWVSPAVPEALRQIAASSGLALAAVPDATTARLDVLNSQSKIFTQQSPTTNLQSTTWIYALVAPFPTVTDAVSLADIQNTWSGTPSGPFAGRPLWVDGATLAAFSRLWGDPAAGAVLVVPSDQLVGSAWAERPAWAIIPFEALEPRWKVLSVDGQSPVHNDFVPASYPLKIAFSVQPAVFNLPPTNRDPHKLTVLDMTGTTALARATADRMDKNGVLYPGKYVDSVLRSADITHISNEVAFDAACPTPDPLSLSLSFCSKPGYIALLEDAGTDVVELTGNHLMDSGQANLLNTLDMYDRLGWKYYGGGRDLQDALQPALLENNGNKLAFVGCDYPGPPKDWATATTPGSLPCNLDQMAEEIVRLRAQGYLPIMTFQYQEYYQPNPTYEEEADFRRMAEDGAVIVSGSQGHEPAAMEILNGAFIHYGLGNLFFDQMFSLPTRELFIDRHVFYNGKYIDTELLTFINEDFAQPRPMTALERTQFLEKIFKVAGW
jgi:poly-gamma-glutamate synthesis protein (capsule biosynthesis protein)